VAEDKKTQLGTPGRTVRPTGNMPSAGGAAASPTPAPSASAALPKTSYLPDTPDPLLGATVAGRYLVQRKLGEGGMGTVYLAMHTILEKSVALKVLHGEFARKPDLVERFMQEAKSASRIRHENVIDISDFGSTPDGLVFFAMELLQGHDLHTEIARARIAGELLPWSRTKRIFLQICAALSAAHGKGVVHRDLKPENVYLVDFLGDLDFVKLLDFGIAKLTEVNQEDGGRKLTKTGMLFGTPEYMSPEQARGESVDHRVDVYAMGCILFQLVTGRVPFEADNFMGVLSLHLTETAPVIAPEVFDRIGAPRALMDVIDRALVKNRDERYQTIDELAAAVREVCGDPPPADRSQPMRAASVPAPQTTTRARTPTGAVVGAAVPGESGPVAAASNVAMRSRTEWKGKLQVPEVAVEPPPKPSSKLPLVLGALVVLGGGGIAAYFATRPGDPSDVAAAPSPSPSPSPSPTPPPTPPPPPVPVLPEHVTLSLDSVPHGATVTDLSTGRKIGTTPMHFDVAGSQSPRQFAFHLHGYGDTTVELVPNRQPIEYVEKLDKGASAGVVHQVPAVVPVKPVAPGSGSAGSAAAPTGPVAHPETDGSGSQSKPPEPQTKPAEPPIKPTEPQTKPQEPPKPCAPDPNDPNACLKDFGSGQ
jgi:serine/threonine-protein kinase